MKNVLIVILILIPSYSMGLQQHPSQKLISAFTSLHTAIQNDDVKEAIAILNKTPAAMGLEGHFVPARTHRSPITEAVNRYTENPTEVDRSIIDTMLTLQLEKNILTNEQLVDLLDIVVTKKACPKFLEKELDPFVDNNLEQLAFLLLDTGMNTERALNTLKQLKKDITVQIVFAELDSLIKKHKALKTKLEPSKKDDAKKDLD